MPAGRGQTLGLAALVLLLLGIVVLAQRRQALLIHAASREDLRLLSLFLFLGAKPGALVDGTTALHAAAWAGRTRSAQRLLDAGAPVDAPDQAGLTPLMTAASQGHSALVRLLLHRGADPLKRASCGRAADLARRNGHPDSAALLESVRSDR